MPIIDLKNYVVAPSGNWLKDPNAFTSAEFILSEPGDQVTFTGPVAIAVTLQSENRTLGPSGAEEKLFFHDVYTYSLSVGPGHTFTYRFGDTENTSSSRILGVNNGFRVVFRPGFIRSPATPVLIGTDLPCDFAVSPIANSGQFFPAGCEPCPPGVPVGLPPGATPTLVEPAPGGCLRIRPFNGMFITREDMETEQRFFRMKNKLQNRAMGKGVVWGLNLQRYANSICIEPGYAVDCCGNDLVVTEPYRVSIDALLRDPASFRFLLDVAGFRRSAVDDCDQPVPPGIIVDPAPQLCRRMHLLLEYVECPQDARPVHGDPCSPEVTRCEMSRIRETVRLRLVPPRDYDPKGPIDKFLDELNAILKEAGITNATPGSTITTSTTLPVPFQIDVNLQNTAFLPAPGFSRTLVPDRTATRNVDLLQRQGGPPSVVPPYVLRFQLRATSGYSISAGQVIGPGNAVVATANPGAAAAFDWPVQIPPFPPGGFPTSGAPVNVTTVYTIQAWQAAPATGQPQLTGTTVVTLSVVYAPVPGSTSPGQGVSLQPLVTVAPTDVQAVVPSLGPYPCNAEACGCDPDLRRFPVFPPFLHDDPRSPGQPVDWKVLLLAVAYGLLVSEEARHHTGTPQAVVTPRLQLALNLYVVVLRAFFGANTPEQRDRLTRAMRCLFQAWCKALLYPGPECEQGIHGVVIGCAQIRGGRIVDVDPWGGRRWVVHYPLLTYWGHQFGIAPLDVTASRLFSMICCLGGLTAPVLDLRGTGITTGIALVQGDNIGAPSTPASSTAAGTQPQPSPIAVGHIFLVAGTRAEALAQLQNAGVSPVATRELGLPEFVSTLLVRLREQPSGAALQYTLFGLQDSPDVHFAAPVSAEASGAAQAAAQPAAAFVDRLPELVRTAPDARTRAAVPPLLRDLSENITADLLRVATIPRIEENPDQPFHRKLVAVGASTYGTLLSRKPEEVWRAVSADYGKELSEILVEGEAVTASGAKAVFGATANVSKATGAVSPSDLNNEDALKQFAAAVTEALSKEKRLVLPEPVVAAVVSTAVKAAAS